MEEKGGEGREYKRKKKEYKELCRKKKKEDNERWEKRAREIRREGEVWELLSKERGRRKRINEGIEQEEWKEYFMGLLGGVERRVILGGERKIGGEKGEVDKIGEVEEIEISGDKIKRAMKRLRDGKAMGLDEIPGEVWKYGGERLERWVRDYCNEVWRGEGWPEG